MIYPLNFFWAKINALWAKKKQKLIQKIFSNHKKFVHLKDEAWEQCGGNEAVYERWVWDACTALHNNPDFPIEDLLPNRLLARVFREVMEQLANDPD
jgi:hypothetical protein